MKDALMLRYDGQIVRDCFWEEFIEKGQVSHETDNETDEDTLSRVGKDRERQ